MRTRVALTLVASATWACGGTSPLPTTGSPQDGYSTLLSSSPDPLVSGSFAAATTVTLTVRVGDGLEGTIENLSFVLRDASGGWSLRLSSRDPSPFPPDAWSGS
jgi:hypothetical protein